MSGKIDFWSQKKPATMSSILHPYKLWASQTAGKLIFIEIPWTRTFFSYSIADFHSLNSTLGDGVTFEQLANFVNFMQDKWSVLTIHDVVWNHAARNSSWLRVGRVE